jgi:hypothetical protein
MRWLFIPLLFLLAGSAQAAYDPAANIKAYGAVCNGTADDGAKINQAIAANAVTWGPDKQTCFSTVTITVPAGKTLRGDNVAIFGLDTTSPGGFTIKCALTVNPCVRVNGGLINVGVDRVTPGTPPAGTTGVALNRTDPSLNTGGMIVIEGVASWNSPIGFSIGVPDAAATPPALGGGFGAFFNRINTCKISDTHLLMASWAETRINMGRFGCYYDVPGNNYIKITGPGWSNSLNVVNSQFNTGPSSLLQCFIRFDGPFEDPPGTPVPPEGWFFDTVHVENHNHGICTNSSAPNIQELQISNSDFWGGFGDWGSEFFFLDPITTLDRVNISNSEFKKHGMYTLAPAAAATDVRISNSRFATNTEEVDISTALGFTFTAKPGSRLMMTGNRIGVLSVLGDFGTGPTAGAGLITGTLGNNQINYHATGPISIDVPGHNLISSNCAVGLQFGGAAVGVTYAQRSCYWQRHGDQVSFSFYIALTNKGTSTGGATVTGLPFQASAGMGVGNSILYAVNMTALSAEGAYVLASTGAGQTYMNLYQGLATGLQSILQSAFTNTSVIQGTVVYMVDGGH